MQTNKNSRLHVRPVEFAPNSTELLHRQPAGPRVTCRLVFGIFAALADFERELIRERTLAGLKAARAKGQQEVRAVEDLASGRARAQP